MRGEARHAALLLGKADGVMDEVGRPRDLHPDFPDARATAGASDALGPEAFAAAYAEGRGMALDDAVALALDVLA